MSKHILWMAPLADAVLFGIAGLVLALVTLRWPKIVSRRTAVFLFAFLGFLSLLISYPLLGRYATLILAAGLAVQTTRVVSRRAEGFNRLVQRSTWVLAVIVISLAAAMYGWSEVKERRALAKLPAASPNAPNVLLITLDTVRARSLSLYGYGRPTSPELERLSKGGVRFDKAISTSSWTLPSHVSMFTGRFSHEMSVGWFKPLDATHPTLAEVLSNHGYATAGFVANLEYCSSVTGLDRGFARYEDFSISVEQIIVSSTLGDRLVNNYLRPLIKRQDLINRKSASELNSNFLSWLSRNEKRPFFAFLNYYDAHAPFFPPQPFDTMFGPPVPGRNPRLSPKRTWTQQDIQLERDNYDASIAYLDQQLGRLFDELERRGALKNTLVIITSDHGEEFTEHGLVGHGYNLYPPALHVPLLILFPSSVPAGASVSEAVSLRDLPATVMDLLKLKADGRFSGNSLARYWDGTRDADEAGAETLLSELKFAPGLPEWYPVSKGDMKSLIAGRFHYIRNGDGLEELYDLKNDPSEMKNLAYADENRPILERFRTSLQTMLIHDN